SGRPQKTHGAVQAQGAPHARSRLMASKAYTVFISATQRDKELAKDLSKRLKSVGVDVAYLDDEVKQSGSKEITQQTYQALRKSDEVFVLLTHNSVDDPWTSFDMGAALSLEKPVTPIVVGVDEKSPPVTLSGYEPVRYSDLEKAIEAVGQRASGTSESRATSKQMRLDERATSRGAKPNRR
ncbi:MAG: toll/interleukin-1 receptor domain-containing protein, partial [Chloroflexi bacterium]|nr:toll/interleukin-1 receptor domain-containing protein [Chloroflexota bacterium]